MKDKYEDLNKILAQYSMATRPSEYFKPVPVPKTTAPAIPKAPKPPKTPMERANDFIGRERARTEPKGSLIMPPAKV